MATSRPPLAEFLRRFIPDPRQSPGREALVAAAALVVAILGGIALGDFMLSFPFITVFPAIMIASALGGPRGGVAVMILGGLFGTYAWVFPEWAFPGPARTALVLTVFWAMGGTIVLIAYLMHFFLDKRARQKAAPTFWPAK